MALVSFLNTKTNLFSSLLEVVTATKISCDGVSDKKGGDIIDCAFDPKGTSLACCVGNQSILVLTNTSAKQIGISEWERTILNGPNHTTILLIDWDVIIDKSLTYCLVNILILVLLFFSLSLMAIC